MVPGSVNTWESTGTQMTESIPVHYAEEIIIPPSMESIVEHSVSPPVVHYSTIMVVEQPQRATISTVEVKIESQEQPSCSQQDSGNTGSEVIKVVRWFKRKTSQYSLIHKRRVVKSKVFLPSIRKTKKCSVPTSLLSQCLADYGNLANFTSRTVTKNYKKRRRKCESEHAH